MIVDLSGIPVNWFLYKLCDIRLPIIYKGDTHEPTFNWGCELQHIQGGRLKVGQGDTPQEAVNEAIRKALGISTEG